MQEIKYFCFSGPHARQWRGGDGMAWAVREWVWKRGGAPRPGMCPGFNEVVQRYCTLWRDVRLWQWGREDCKEISKSLVQEEKYLDDENVGAGLGSTCVYSTVRAWHKWMLEEAETRKARDRNLLKKTLIEKWGLKEIGLRCRYTVFTLLYIPWRKTLHLVRLQDGIVLATHYRARIPRTPQRTVNTNIKAQLALPVAGTLAIPYQQWNFPWEAGRCLSHLLSCQPWDAYIISTPSSSRSDHQG